jgi:hypothetical protein
MNAKEGALISAVVLLTCFVGYLILVPGTGTGGIPAGQIQVTAEGYVKNDQTFAAVATCPVYVYDTPTPVAGSALDVASTDSDGKFTISAAVLAGQTLYFQARKNDPASADPYIGPITALTVPLAAENGDTVKMGTLLVKDVSATAPTLSASDSGNNAISDNSQNYANTTDTRITVLLSEIDSNTWYGSDDFTDGKTGKVYWGSVIVWKGTTNQPFTGYDYVVNTPTYVYYIWHIDAIVDTAADPNDGIATCYITASSNLVADATVVLSAYDVVDYAQMQNGVFTTASTVTAITTKVA